MKIICVNGSPRGRNSITQMIAAKFLEGARKAGAEVETVFLVEKKIGYCKACLSCWIKTPGVCVQKDDMAELLESVIKSDIVVFATPVYADNVTGNMKIFIDRMIPTLDPRVIRVQGETVHVKRYDRYPKIVVISNSGFPEQTHFQTLRLYFRRLSRNMHSEVIGEIYRGGGGILSVKNPLLKSIISSYMKLLRKAGEKVVREGRLSEKTMEKLEKPLVPHDQFAEGMNQYFEKRLSQLSQKDDSD